MFLFVTGIEVTTGQKPNMDNALSLFSNTFLLKLWLSALALAIFLKLVHSKIQHHLLVPAFYTFVPLAFYAIAVGICGYSISELRDMGWLFDLPSSSSSVSSSSSSSPLSSTLPPFYTFWTYFDFSLIDASALAACIPTILALSFFGILHVPINVPALAVSSKQDVDINHEIVGHGVSNIIAGLLGTCQNYLVYTNSVLFMRSGGDSRIAGVLLAIATSVVWIFGESFIGLIPTVAVGALIFHLSIDLVKESVIDTWNVGILPLEYATIIVIIVVMTIAGFTEGIIVGIILACLFFVVMYSRKSIIRSTASGKECRSTVHRLYRQQKFLDDVGSQILIIKLQGFMFFGTINQCKV